MSTRWEKMQNSVFGEPTEQENSVEENGIYCPWCSEECLTSEDFFDHWCNSETGVEYDPFTGEKIKLQIPKEDSDMNLYDNEILDDLEVFNKLYPFHTALEYIDESPNMVIVGDNIETDYCRKLESMGLVFSVWKTDTETLKLTDKGKESLSLSREAFSTLVHG